jgi:hypothetical protein
VLGPTKSEALDLQDGAAAQHDLDRAEGETAEGQPSVRLSRSPRSSSWLCAMSIRKCRDGVAHVQGSFSLGGDQRTWR